MPEEDPHWENFLRLLDIVDIVLAPKNVPGQIGELKELIEEHHSAFRYDIVLGNPKTVVRLIGLLQGTVPPSTIHSKDALPCAYSGRYLLVPMHAVIYQ